ncbi:uncharacterized protein LOC128549365 [Mercenaria mercenaria]|uniref:uncharacterized protein LOC128549365 n=1 Tax=Mercenaria mercenaria TaxID=6596 RepID=UPI00234F1B08|nr:uncharacterized protein LOC128549365 [Mercenaria mercenaria]
MYRSYNLENLQRAVSAVRRRQMGVRSAATEFNVPKSTLHDHVNRKETKDVKQEQTKLLTIEEENALVQFIQHQARQGFPMTRSMVRCYVREIVRRSGRETAMNLESGPSDKWFRALKKRHPELSERTPECLDRARCRMSNQETMNGWFELLRNVLETNQLKESQIYNVDESGWSGKEKPKIKVLGPKQTHTFSAKNVTSGHVTANICICADGKILPTMVIFKGSFPHRKFDDGIPDSWLSATSESGYMDGDLFLSWFRMVFVPNCGKERPVLLVLDNHDSHVTLPLVECARENNIILLGMPAHTTHILQPLDVKVNGPLKNRFSSLAVKLGFVNRSFTVQRAEFPIVLRHALEQTTPASVRVAFAVTGIVPFNPKAIDTSQLVPPTFKKTNPQNGNKENTNVRSCETCGSFLVNPLVDQGLIPERMADVLMPPPMPPMKSGKKASRRVPEGRVISGDEMLKLLKEKEDAARREKEEKEERQRQREERRIQRQKEEEERLVKRQKREEDRRSKALSKEMDRMKRAVGGRLAAKKFTCSVCGERGRMNDEINGVMWYGCDESMCERWYHEECLSMREREYLLESMSERCDWFCRQCKPWLYVEE